MCCKFLPCALQVKVIFIQQDMRERACSLLYPIRQMLQGQCPVSNPSEGCNRARQGPGFCALIRLKHADVSPQGGQHRSHKFLIVQYLRGNPAISQ